jgi:CheY-like chemotaxis protein
VGDDVRPNRILVIEDDPDQLEAILAVTMNVFQGVEIIHYSDGWSAARAIVTHQIPRCDVAIIDRLLTWGEIDDLAVEEVQATLPPPSSGQRGLFLARSLLTDELRPRIVIFLTVLGDDPDLHLLDDVPVRYVRKDSSLDGLFAELQFIYRTEVSGLGGKR